MVVLLAVLIASLVLPMVIGHVRHTRMEKRELLEEEQEQVRRIDIPTPPKREWADLWYRWCWLLWIWAARKATKMETRKQMRHIISSSPCTTVTEEEDTPDFDTPYTESETSEDEQTEECIYLPSGALFSGRSLNLRELIKLDELVASIATRGTLDFAYDWFIEDGAKVTRDLFVKSGRLTQTNWDLLIGSADPDAKKGPGWWRVAGIIKTNGDISYFEPESAYEAWQKFKPWWEKQIELLREHNERSIK